MTNASFTRAITRTPSHSLVSGLTSAGLGEPDIDLALSQHQDYIEALKACGLAVTNLPPMETFPDATFVEDTALITPACAVLTRPGAPTRRNEIISMRTALEAQQVKIEAVDDGTIDAGDIMMVGQHYYIGLSERTNQAGADAMIEILQRYGMTASTVHMTEMLHLKTGINFLDNNQVLVTGELINSSAFEGFDRLVVRPGESYAANSLWINDTVLVPAGFPATLEMIQQAGYRTLTIDVSEFQKLDGGLSCLSLRF